MLECALQAGTYAGDPVSVAAGIKALEVLGREGAYERLSALSRRLVDGLVQGARAAGHAAWGQSFGGGKLVLQANARRAMHGLTLACFAVSAAIWHHLSICCTHMEHSPASQPSRILHES